MSVQKGLTRRSMLVAATGGVSLSVFGQQPTAADERTQNNGQAGNGQWTTLTPGVKLLRTWENGGPEWPQVAILDLPQDVHEKFHDNPRDFVNKHKVFPQPVRKMGGCFTFQDGGLFAVIPKPTPTPTPDPPKGCKAIVIHNADSSGG